MNTPGLLHCPPLDLLISYIYLLIISSPADCIEEVANGYWCSSLVSWIVSCSSVFANWPTYNPVNREHAWVWFVVQTYFVMLTTLQRHLEGQTYNTTLRSKICIGMRIHSSVWNVFQTMRNCCCSCDNHCCYCDYPCCCLDYSCCCLDYPCCCLENAKVINHLLLICAKANGAPSGAIVSLNPNPFPNYLKSKASTWKWDWTGCILQGWIQVHLAP